MGQRTEVIGASMNPTLVDGDNLILDKISYRFHDPERYDIVVFPFRNGENKNYIKSIIGLPGEKVRISEEGEIYINGEVLHESYGLEVIKNPGTVIEEMTLGEGEYFVLGDNRNNSEDSRNAEIGIVSSEMIEGEVWFVLSPAEHRGFL